MHTSMHLASLNAVPSDLPDLVAHFNPHQAKKDQPSLARIATPQPPNEHNQPHIHKIKSRSVAAALSDTRATMATMSDPERAMPPLDSDERSSLESWLDFYRATLAQKCDGLDEEQLRRASAAPSPITLLGLVRHMAEVERTWFRRILVQEDIPFIFDPDSDRQSSADEGFPLATGDTYAAARPIWRAEIDRARENCAAHALDDTSPFPHGHVTLRWIYTHMIAEYARHCGHADLVRERIDGVTGV
ncbi:DinB family protein [Parasphingorhabdus pacifica]